MARADGEHERDGERPAERRRLGAAWAIVRDWFLSRSQHAEPGPPEPPDDGG